MRLLHIIGFLVLLGAAIFLAVPAFLPKTISISESTFVETRPQLFFRQVNNLKRWVDWSPFEARDPDMVSVYTEKTTGSGASHSWTSAKLGNGSQTIIESAPYSFIRLRVDFEKEGVIHNHWHFEEYNNGTEVWWTITFDELRYPFGRIMGLFIPGYMRNIMREGLSNLTIVAQAQPDPIEVIECNLQAFSALCIADSVLYDQIGSRSFLHHQKIQDYIGLLGIHADGHAFTFFDENQQDESLRFLSGIPVFGETRESGKIVFMQFGQRQALLATHYGDHSELGYLHEQIQLFAAEQEILISGKAWEIYINGPLNDTIPENWVTEVAYELKYSIE